MKRFFLWLALLLLVVATALLALRMLGGRNQPEYPMPAKPAAGLGAYSIVMKVPAPGSEEARRRTLGEALRPAPGEDALSPPAQFASGLQAGQGTMEKATAASKTDTTPAAKPMQAEANGTERHTLTPEPGPLAKDTQEAAQASKQPSLSQPTPQTKDQVAATPSTPQTVGAKPVPQAVSQAAPQTSSQTVATTAQKPATSPATPPAPAKPATPAAPPAPAKASAPAPARTTAAAPIKTATAASAQSKLPAPQPGRNQVDSLVLAAQGAAVTLTITTHSPVSGFTSFSMAGPPRFVLDLPGKWERETRQTSTPNAMVEAVRHGQHPDKFRVVLDLKPGVTVKPSVAQTGPSTLVVTLQ